MNIMIAQIIFFSSLSILSIGAIISACLGKRETDARIAGTLFAAAGSFLGMISGTYFLFTGAVFKFNLPLSLPGFDLAFNIDRLAAFFITFTALICLLSSIYAFGYLKHYQGKYNLGALGFFYNVFIASLLLVPAADNLLFFLTVWELMSVTSYFLVIFEKDKAENIKAGFLYFLMTHVGTAFILISFLLLNKYTGSFSLSEISALAGNIPSGAVIAIFFASLIGFGMKAGIIPLHIWLPEAHPAAPSYVSAIMSGAMIKMGIYMLFRIFIDILPGLPPYAGATVLIIGAISSLFGVLYALAEHDIKKLLAFSSIENIGIILLGLGSGMIFISQDLKSLAALALAASLFHVVNHGIFKALLFLGAGSIISATHTRNMEEHGGLIKKMPQTALFFLIGSLAISAIPPFNGFWSEWLCFQTLFSGANLNGGLSILFLIAAGSLAFTGALAAACFVKAFGISFLARPRSKKAEEAHEVGQTMRFGMGALALLAVIFGLFSGSIAKLLAETSLTLNNLSGGKLDSTFSFSNLQIAGGWSFVSAPAVFAGLIIACLIAAAIVYFSSRKNKVRIDRTWDCGNDLKPRMEITAAGFSNSIVTIFRGVLKPTKQAGIEYHDDEMRYLSDESGTGAGHIDIYQQYLYQPLKKAAYFLSEKTKKIQNGNANLYILYIFITLILLLLIAVK